jgi:hypothetical protein
MATATNTESALEKSKEFLRVYSMLIRAAQQRGFVTEDDVADLMGVMSEERQSSRSTAKMLELIADREKRSGRPILSAVVLTSATHRPVRAFQKSASDLGLLPAKVSKDQRDSFWQAELKRVYDEWAD